MSFSGERLKIARKYKKLTIDRLISEVNENYGMKLNNGMVSKWENNKVMPRIEAIQILADYLAIPADYLLGKQSLGNSFLELRLKANLTLENLSEKTGIKAELIKFIESDLASPNNIEIDNLLNNLNYIKDSDAFLTDYLEGFEEPQENDDDFIFYREIMPYINELDDRTVVDLEKVLEELSKMNIFYRDRLLKETEWNRLKKIIRLFLAE